MNAERPAPNDLEHALDPDREAWERQSWETTRAFAAFILYRDAGLDRTLIGAYRAFTGRPEVRAESIPGNVRAWRNRNLWDLRAAHYDRDQDRVRLAARRRDVLAMQRRQADTGRALHDRGAAVLLKLLPTDEQLDEPDGLRRLLGRMTPAELLRAVDLGTRTERLALGEPTEIGETAVRATVRAMSDDEARAFSGLDE